MNKKNLLLIHGGPGLDDSYFFPFLSPLEEFYNLISYRIGSRCKDYSLDSLVHELENVINKIDGDNLNVLAHSFASVILLNSKDKVLNRFSNLILSNWIYNTEWIDIFHKKYPEAAETEGNSLKEDMLKQVDYYFCDINLGTKVLNQISFSDEIYQQSLACYEHLDLSLRVEKHLNKITSVCSEFDKIVPSEYISMITNRLNIKNYLIPNAGHFPFAEQPEIYLNNLKHIINN